MAEVVVGDACRNVDEEGARDLNKGPRTAISIVRAFVVSWAHILILEYAATLLRSTEWEKLALPTLSRHCCCVESATVVGNRVDIPTTERRPFIVAARGIPETKNKLRSWKRSMAEIREDKPP